MVYRAIAICIVAVSAAAARADVVNVISARDNTLYESSGSALSNGAGTHFFVGENGEGDRRRGVIYFDVADALPPGAMITGATLQLHMSRAVSGASPVELHRLTADWGEAGSHAAGEEGSGAPAQPGDATWQYRFYNTQPWATEGGDFDPAVSASTSVGGIGFYTWSSSALLADVRSWLSSPATNFGWLVLGDETTASTTKRFDTRENTEPTFRPVLQITYVPEPAASTLALLALAARRRIP